MAIPLTDTFSFLLDNGADVVTNPDGSKKAVQKVRRPYRFVFMDGCDSGKTGDWPLAFGIDMTFQKDVAPYQQAGVFIRRPSAFLGWDFPVPAGNSYGVMEPKSAEFRNRLIYRWTVIGQNITDALAGAFDDAAGTWTDVVRNHIVMTGYSQIHFHECNQDDMNMQTPYD